MVNVARLCCAISLTCALNVAVYAQEEALNQAAQAATAPQVQAQPVRPWTHPEVLVAALQIRMTEEQRSPFRTAITEFLEGFGSDVRRVLNGNNTANLPRQIAVKRRNRAKAMDKAMAEFLDPGQYELYEIYRDRLLQKMDEEAAARRRGR